MIRTHKKHTPENKKHMHGKILLEKKKDKHIALASGIRWAHAKGHIRWLEIGEFFCYLINDTKITKLARRYLKNVC
jgi:hypothetical protein